MAFQNNKLPIHIVTGEVKSTSGGFSAVETALGVYKNVPSAAGQTNTNDKVEVMFGDPQNRRLPVIVSNRSVKQSETLVKLGSNDPTNPIELSPGLWLQHLGYWHTPNQSNNAQPVFDMAPLNFTSKTSQQVIWENIPGQGGRVDLHFLENIHTGGPNKPWKIYVDSNVIADKSGGGDPFNPFDNLGMLHLKFQPARPDLGIMVEHSIFIFNGNGSYPITDPPLFTTEVVTADYFVLTSGVTDTTQFISPGQNGNALATSMTFRGVVAFPFGGEQQAAMLTGVYESDGPINTTWHAENETINFVSSGNENPPQDQLEGIRFVTDAEPTNTPVVGNTLNTTFWPMALQGGDPVLVLEPPQTCWLQLLLTNAESIEIWYQYRDPGPGLITGGYHNETADGSTDTFIPFFNQVPFNLPDGTASVPDIEIDDQNNAFAVFVNSVQDLFATFFEDQVTLSFTPNNGDIVEIYFDYWELQETNEYFNTPGLIDYVTSQPIHKLWFMQVSSESPTTNLMDWAVWEPEVARIRVGFLFAAGDAISLNYEYSVSYGEKWKINALRVYEKNVVTAVQKVHEVPISPAWPANMIPPPVAGDPNEPVPSQSFIDPYAGQLFYDVQTQAYTIAGPTGLIWRSRTELANPAPSGPPTPAAHYKLTPWPDDGNSGDAWLTDPTENPTPIVYPRRAAPWYGFSCAGRYGLQGTWNRVGGYHGDTDMLIRLWKRDETTKAWQNHVNRSVTTLCGDHATTFPLRVCPVGTTTPFTFLNTLGKNWSWPSARNQEAWFVAAPWIVHDYAYDWSEPPYDAYAPLGWEDAGLTINAIGPETGNILASLTIRASKTDFFPIYSDLHKRMDDVLAAASVMPDVYVDKYVNGNPIYWPPASGPDPATPWLGGIIWLADHRFNEYPPGSYSQWWMQYKLVGYNGTTQRIRNYPGIPRILNGDAGSYQQYAWQHNSAYWFKDEDNPMNNKFPVDNDNCMYLLLSIPVWIREQDVEDGPPLNETLTGSDPPITYPDASYGPVSSVSPPFIDIACSVVVFNATFTINGTPGIPLVDRQFYTGFAEMRRIFRYYRGYSVSGSFPNFMVNIPPVTISAQWTRPNPDPAVCTPGSTYSMIYCAEFPTFLGFQCSPMPYSGLRYFTYQRKSMDSYTTTDYKVVMVKIKYDAQAATLTELWRKDITEMGKWGAGFSGSTPYSTYALEDTPKRTIGPIDLAQTVNGIFVVRTRRTEFTLGVQGGPPSGTYTIKQVLEVYSNPTDTNPPALLQTVDIPTMTQSGTNNGFYFVGQGGFGLYHITADVDADGKDHVTIWSAANGFPFTALQTTMHFTGADLSVPPAVSYVQGDFDEPPRTVNYGESARRMGRAASNYFWEDRNGTGLWRKDLSQ